MPLSTTGNDIWWREREMVERWVASAWLLKEKNFRKIDGYRDLWALATGVGHRSGADNLQFSQSQEKLA